MTREEYLAAIRDLSGIDVPTEDQQAKIETLVSVFDASQTSDRITELENELSTERSAHEALRQRFRESFWSGKPMKSGNTEPEKKSGYDISINDFFK